MNSNKDKKLIRVERQIITIENASKSAYIRGNLDLFNKLCSKLCKLQDQQTELRRELGLKPLPLRVMGLGIGG